MKNDKLTPPERRALARERMQDRIRAGMKAMLEEIPEEEMTEHLQAGDARTARGVERALPERSHH